jgi:phenylpyruvate tautomerase PptA (4-oxalocrotonate tautomerase family)
MPFVKLHVSSRCVFSRRALVREVRLALVETLGISPDHGHVVLYESSIFSRSTHESRNRDFVLAEIIMFPGRPDDMKERLFARLNEIIHGRTGVPEKDIVMVIVESERKNWAARGGVPISSLDIGY